MNESARVWSRPLTRRDLVGVVTPTVPGDVLGPHDPSPLLGAGVDAPAQAVGAIARAARAEGDLWQGAGGDAAHEQHDGITVGRGVGPFAIEHAGGKGG